MFHINERHNEINPALAGNKLKREQGEQRGDVGQQLDRRKQQMVHPSWQT